MSMTESEFAIVECWLREAMEYGEERHNEPYEKAIQALSEIQQYRVIGTVSEFQQLKEKATAKKPIVRYGRTYTCPPDCGGEEFDEYGNIYHCPSCGRKVESIIDGDLCRCGQKLDWSEGKE